jgi:UDP-N-acetylglucosamine acyltransferase
MAIHVTAVVDRRAEVDPSADIGPYCIIEPGAHVGPDTRLIANVYVCGSARIGARCRIHPFAVIGDWPQDLSCKGEPSYVEIGDDCWIREGVTIHRGTEPDTVTRVGAKCFLMANSHIGHNCQVGERVIMAQGSVLGGRVEIGSGTFIGGNSAVHQFCRVGELAMIGGLARLVNDLPPYLTFAEGRLVGPNVVGLRRNNLGSAERLEIRELFRALFRAPGDFREKLANAKATTEPGRKLLEFLQVKSKRGLCGSIRRRGDSGSDVE